MCADDILEDLTDGEEECGTQEIHYTRSISIQIAAYPLGRAHALVSSRLAP